jgi:Domain of unknown function (DUF3883)
MSFFGMAMGEDWSSQEVNATVFDYMSMLKFELAGQRYNKTAHRRSLLGRLGDRSEGAVEMKHQNISAVLRDLGHFWIPGYKPRSNYQGLLVSGVEAWIRGNPELERHELAAAESPAATPEHFDFSVFEVGRPTLAQARKFGVQETQAPYGEQVRVGIRRDYAACEARNSSLGKAGEELVLRFEQYRLSRLGYDRLAAKVEHVSKTQGDGLGFDILSFNTDGEEHFIEVKTTAFAKETPFYASSSEIRFARKNAERYSLRRLFEFRKAPKCYTLPGVIENHCALNPVTYRCSFL